MLYQKKYLMVIAVFLLGNFINFAQKNDVDSTIIKIKKENVFDVYFINGYALGYNLVSYPKSEFRISLDLSASYSSNIEDRKSIYSSRDVENNDEYKSESDGSSYSINFTFHYLMNMYRSSFGEAYFGFGPFLGYSGYDHSSNNSRESIESERLNSLSNISVGLTTLIGLRSIMTKSLSIFAEVQLTSGKSWNESKNNSTYFEETNTQKYSNIINGDGWFYNLTLARIGLRFTL